MWGVDRESKLRVHRTTNNFGVACLNNVLGDEKSSREGKNSRVCVL